MNGANQLLGMNLGASHGTNRGNRAKKLKAGATQLSLGSARVSRALVGVPPTSRARNAAYRPVHDSSRRSHRRDADGSDRDGRAPLSNCLVPASPGRSDKRRLSTPAFFRRQAAPKPGHSNPRLTPWATTCRCSAAICRHPQELTCATAWVRIPSGGEDFCRGPGAGNLFCCEAAASSRRRGTGPPGSGMNSALRLVPAAPGCGEGWQVPTSPSGLGPSAGRCAARMVRKSNAN